MILRKLVLTVVALLLLSLLVSAVACTPVEVQALQGTLKNVDSVSGNVTVTMKDNTTQTFNFSDVTVDTIQEALGAASFKIGDLVTIKAGKDGKIEEVDSHNAQIEGVIKSVSADNVTITTNKMKDITLKITADTLIKAWNDQTPTAANLKVGQKVEASYEVNSLKALKISVDTGDTVKEIQGIIKAVTTEPKTVTITPNNSDNVTLKVVAETTLRIGDKDNTSLSELAPGMKVEARYNTGNNDAIRISVNAGETINNVQGDIKAVDAEAKTITVTTQHKGEMVLKITGDTVIRMGDRGTSKFEDLKAGQKIEVRYGVTNNTAIRINIDAGKNNQTNGQTNEQNNGQHNGQNSNQNNGQNNGQRNNQNNGRGNGR